MSMFGLTKKQIFSPMALAVLTVLCGFFSYAARASDQRLKTEALIQVGENQFQRVQVEIDEQCTAELAELTTLSQDYTYAAYNGAEHSQKKANAAKSSIDALFAKIHQTKRVCYDELTSFYAFNSFVLLHSMIKYPSHSAQIKLAIELYKRRVFQPITPEMRAELGGLWSEKGRRERYRIMGAYDCNPTNDPVSQTGESRIWFDPSLPQFDLGAVIQHELDHLTRDKLLYQDASFVSGNDPYFVLLMDETMAALHTAYTQMSLRRDENRKSDYEVKAHIEFYGSDGKLGWKREQMRRFTISGDMDLYSIGGPMERVWKKIVRSQGYPKYAPFSQFFPFLLNDDNSKSMRTIVGRVSKSYFPLFPPASAQAVERIKKWSVTDSMILSPMMDFEKRVTQGEDPKKFIDDILERLSQASPGCTLLSQAIRDGRARGYGTQAQDSPIRGGHEGVRPTTPIKGGHEGVRPTDGVLPCIDPDGGV